MIRKIIVFLFAIIVSFGRPIERWYTYVKSRALGIRSRKKIT